MNSSILCLFLVAVFAGLTTAAEPGFVQVYNSGGYVTWIVASYKSGGQRKEVSTDSYPIGQTKTIHFPSDATEIVVTPKVGIFWGYDSDIFTKTYSSPPKDCFKVWGITLSTSWAKVDC